MIKVGVAGVGAIGSVICEAICAGRAPGMRLAAVADIVPTPYDSVRRPLAEFGEICDIIVEALPPEHVSALAVSALSHGKTIILSSTGTLSTYPEILQTLENSKGRIIGPYGALTNMPGISKLKNNDFSTVQITSTKPPAGFGLENLAAPRVMFEGHAKDAVIKYGKNANVSASLAFATGLLATQIKVKIIADPTTKHNSHHVQARGADGSEAMLDARVSNMPDPNNPKTSLGTADSVLAALLSPDDAFFVINGGKRA